MIKQTITNIFYAFMTFLNMARLPDSSVFPKLLQISNKKKNLCKWSFAIQTHVVQGPTIFYHTLKFLLIMRPVFFSGCRMALKTINSRGVSKNIWSKKDVIRELYNFTRRLFYRTTHWIYKLEYILCICFSLISSQMWLMLKYFLGTLLIAKILIAVL